LIILDSHTVKDWIALPSWGFKMQILMVGIGALGGTIAARAIRTGLPVRLAARNTDSAKALHKSGLRQSS
jgi:glycerol-3-phosphate dehydrogenase